MRPSKRLTGMPAFSLVWAGQILSLFGSAMTRFALTIWAWDLTGEATALAIVAFAAYAPEVLLSPLAGAFVDRWNRKWVMMLSDLAAGLSSVAILLLYLAGQLQIWQLWVTGAFAGASAAFQWPAYSAAVSVMVAPDQYARASGMLSLAESGSRILAPAAAGALIGLLGPEVGFNGLSLILFVDVVTFVFAIAALLVVHIPSPQRSASGQEGQGTLWHESLYGWRYIWARPSLLGLQLVFLMGNFLTGLAFTLLPPMILARTQNDSALLGAVNAVGATGGVLGGLVLSLWGGPRRKVHGVLLSWAGIGLCQALLGLGVPFWFAGLFLAEFVNPTLNGSNQAIWQAKVPPDVQGRVFSIRSLIAQVVGPVAVLLSGPLADRLFEPAMRTGGSWAASFGWLVGTGPGAGMALIFIGSGLLLMALGVLPYAIPAIREVEALLPDAANL